MSQHVREPLVLIPGLGCSPRLYEAQIPALWSLGSVQLADHTRGETIEEIAAAILRDAPARFALAGLSMGGYLAMAIMRMAPERVTRLALLDTSAAADTPEQGERRRAAIAVAEADDEAALLTLVKTNWPLMVDEAHVNDAAMEQAFRSMLAEVGLPAYIRQQRAIMGRPDSLPGLAAIACPTLVLVGASDRLTPPARAAEMHERIAGSQLAVIAGAGHLATMEAPGAVTDALMTWRAGKSV